MSFSLFEIHVENYPVFIHLGCYPLEQLCPQEVLVSLKVVTKLSEQALENDSIEQVLNYELLVKETDFLLKNNSIKLLERTVYILGRGLMKAFDQIQSCEVSISKKVLPKSKHPLSSICVKSHFVRELF